MSLCQTSQSSCGACCGLFNLDYPYKKLKSILEERTDFFIKNVDYQKKETVISFREEFENKEQFLTKKDVTIYNCPFLGYIDIERKRIGCMIHPIKTGDPKSQNFSFYGAAICQSYDCKNKERENIDNWENLFNLIQNNEYTFSMLASDHIMISRIEDFFLECGISKAEMFQNYQILLKKILKWKLQNQSLLHLTSFEIDMETNVNTSNFEKLTKYISLKSSDSLYLELEKIYLESKNKIELSKN